MPNKLMPTPASAQMQLTLFDLEALEEKVREGLTKFMEVGQALAEIRDREGYRLRGFKDFEDYCVKQFGFSLRHGQRLIAAAETAERVKQLTGEAPRNEATARVLSSIAADDKTIRRVDAELKKRKASIATATAEKIQEVIDRVTGKANAKDTTDDGKGNPLTGSERTKPVKIVPALANLSDECPHCHLIPVSYVQQDGAWTCGSCSKPVRIGVSPLTGQLCPSCSAVVGAADDFCGRCGELLK